MRGVNEEMNRRYLPGLPGREEERGIKTKGSAMEIHIYYLHFNVTLIIHMRFWWVTSGIGGGKRVLFSQSPPMHYE
jgi:hypothetical protein